jgi:lipid-A-disaccharide synthase
MHANIRFWWRFNAKWRTLVKHYRELAFMGFVEVLFNLKTILGNIKICKNDIAEFKPDVIILLTILALICVLQNGQKRKASQHTIISPNMGLERKSHH